MSVERISFGRRIKGGVARWIPSGLVKLIKKFYYPYQFRRYSDENWPLIKPVRQLIGPGDYVVDIGANIGYVTMFLAREVGETGAVFSVEPVPHTYDLLAHNVQALKLNNVRVYDCAVSSESGRALMGIPEYHVGGQNYYESHLLKNSEQNAAMKKVEVELKTLDAIVREYIDRISFVKIDVEGHELAAIQGAGELINRSHPSFLIEVSEDPDNPNSTAHILFETMRSAGYYAYVEHNGSMMRRTEGYSCGDYFFLTDAHIKKMGL